MSLDKAIEHGKEHRRQYHDSRRFSRYCTVQIWRNTVTGETSVGWWQE